MKKNFILNKNKSTKLYKNYEAEAAVIIPQPKSSN